MAKHKWSDNDQSQKSTNHVNEHQKMTNYKLVVGAGKIDKH